MNGNKQASGVFSLLLRLGPLKGLFGSVIGKVFAAVLLISVAGNVVQGLLLRSYISSAADCKATVKVVTKEAIQIKKEVEVKYVTVSKSAADRTKHRLDTVLDSLSGEGSGRERDLPTTPPSTGNPDATTEAPELLPNNRNEEDRRICVTNTILLEELQQYERDMTNAQFDPRYLPAPPDSEGSVGQGGEKAP